MPNAFSGSLTGGSQPATAPVVSAAPTSGNVFAGTLTGKAPVTAPVKAATVAPITPVAPLLPAGGASTAPSANPALISPTTTPNAFKGSLGGGYGASNITDQYSGKPLLTYEDPQTKSSDLLANRVAPTFDPTIPQKIDPSVLHNGRMPEAASEAVRQATGAEPDEQLDHLISLELGGSNDTSNLNNEKLQSNGTQPSLDLENQTAKDVASGKISYIDGQKIIARAKGVQLPDDADFASSAHSLAGGYPNPAPNQTGTQSQQPSFLGKIENGAKTFVNDITHPFTEGAGQTLVDKFPALTQTLADIQTNPLNLGASIKDIVSTPFTDVKQASDAFNAAVGNLITGIKSGAPASKDINSGLQAATAFAGGVLTPITTWFNVANKIPVIGGVSKLLFNVPFSLLGDTSGDTGVKVLNSLPISDQAKQNLEPGIRAVSALAGQILLGKYVAPDVVSTLTDKFGKADAETIVSKAREVAQEAKDNPTAPAGKETAPASTPTPEPKATAATSEAAPPPEVTPIDATGQTKVSGIAKSIEADAIAKGLTDKFENLAGFEGRNVKDQASKVANLIANDEGKARDIVDGNAELPKDMSVRMFMNGMEDFANKNNEAGLLNKLASSPLTSESSIHAQEMRFAQERDPDSPVERIKSVREARESAVQKKNGGKSVDVLRDKVRDDVTKEIRKASTRPRDWNAFIDEITC